jgi:PleD family two-component response regulator
VAQDCGAALQAWLAQQPSGETALLARPLTVSIGAAQARPGDSAQVLLARADAALYQAKSRGRNRLEWAE